MKQRIKDIADIQIGYQFREKPDMASDSTHQFIQAKDIDRSNDHSLDVSTLYHVTPKRNAGKYKVNNGDVIFLSKGRRNYATLVEGLQRNIKTIVAGYFFILRLKTDGILPKYLAWAINQPPAQNYLQTVSRGSGMPFIPKDAFASLEIDIPAIKTQELILKLHELSLRERALLKRLEQKRNELIRGICLEAIRQANR